jgi:hypothetical protein
MFDLGEHDELIFTIKNYNYIDSPYIFLFRARKSDMDANGEVIFKITPEVSKHLKPGAFYTFAALLNTLDARQETEYRKLTGNGEILIEYGAQDLSIGSSVPPSPGALVDEILDIHLELVDDGSFIATNSYKYEVQGMRLEPFEDTTPAALTLEDLTKILLRSSRRTK